MQDRNLIHWMCLVSFGFGSIHIAQAQTSTARFLLWQPSAISNAMGGVGTSLYGDAFSAYYNPAALSFTKSISLTGSFVKPLPFFGNIAHSFFGASYHSNSFGTIAVSANLFWKGAQILTGELDPTPLGSFNETDWSGKISYALPIKKNLALGASLGLLHINILNSDRGAYDKFNPTVIMLDFGALFKNLLPQTTYSPSGFAASDLIKRLTDDQKENGISVGLSLLNLGSKVTFIDHAQADNLPARLMLGATYLPIRSDALALLLASDFEKQLYESSILQYIHLGGEARILRLLAFRAGYYLDTFGRKTSYHTWGGGIQLKFLSVNVARYTRAILPTWHFDGAISLEL